MAVAQFNREKALALRSYLYDHKGVIKKASRPGVDVERTLQLIVNEIPRTPKLVRCAPESVLRAAVQCGQLGLEPDGVRGHAYIIPRWNGKTQSLEAQMQPGYKGLMVLAWRSEKIGRLDAQWVYQGDVFEYEFGLEEKLVHRPDHEHGAPVTGVYSIAWLTTGAPPQFKVMSRLELDAHKEKFAPRDKDQLIVGPWVQAEPWMQLKTIIIVNCKTLPCGDDLARAIAIDEQTDTGVPPAVDVDFEVEPDGDEKEPETSSDDANQGGTGYAEDGQPAWKAKVCSGCGRAWAFINGEGGAPGMGHGQDCPDAHKESP